MCVCGVGGGGGGGQPNYFVIIEYELSGIVMSIKFPESVDIEVKYLSLCWRNIIIYSAVVQER